MIVCECCGNDEATAAVCTDCLNEHCTHGNEEETTNG